MRPPSALIAPTGHEPVMPQGIATALALLLEAHECACAFQLDRWELALELRYPEATGVTPSELRWLLLQRYVEKGVETTEPKAKRRVFSRMDNLALGPRTCFVLTPSGVAHAHRLAPYASQFLPGCFEVLPVAPKVTSRALHWDRSRRQLCCGPIVIKEFRRPAQPQELPPAMTDQRGSHSAPRHHDGAHRDHWGSGCSALFRVGLRSSRATGDSRHTSYSPAVVGPTAGGGLDLLQLVAQLLRPPVQLLLQPLAAPARRTPPPSASCTPRRNASGCTRSAPACAPSP